ncbi:hypothetical protein [Duncaniella freteri]|uniref:Uncharacterized protein n=2 Tax=Duncaniella freteri TaxID=2530391 RepID=A0A4Z0V4C0_9BACT|nr:hypothetical protein [Duncaniella freteri]TGG34883.1 hypothetical protein EZ315_16145 [Duncaniella freteri]TGG36198.1 hypothetical protein EZ315_09965 [Duncaniella freteri]TGG37131.1 hypothetical protein EZ315_15155 [Duncaniella freteri]TGG39187.1 hypothetical protein EZ315_00075 [Duncaniella freteri]TGG40945.1 hypothetical protein EZ315_09820 [Duncaniella freteri]
MNVSIKNGVPMVNGMLVAWADIVVLVGGVPVTGITGVEYGDEQEIVNKWGAGRHPVGRAKGRITPSAKITLYHEEVVALQSQSVNGRLQDLPPIEIQVSYLPENGVVVTDKIRNCHISSNTRKWKEGDTGQEVELPLVPSHIEWGKAA